MYSADRKPNIVLVVLDTHRRDRLGCYGYPRGTSPNLDTFAREATVFENAISPAQWTIPSHASMFSGEPPSVHRALQASDVLDSRFTTLAERLRSRGYRTVGFCNNPLVGVLDNGLRRGFDLFYNYGGAFPSRPNGATRGILRPLSYLSEFAAHSLRKIAYPIQNAFANSAGLFRGALDPFWVPIWTRIANFKGNTSRSIRDAVYFIEEQMTGNGAQPHLIFINLMETHLPYSVPDDFREAFAPCHKEKPAARDFLRRFNVRAADWISPLEEPFCELEMQALSEMYDAEVAYQDHLLAELLGLLDQPRHRDETMVVFVADHGEMLGEHQLMGHAFGVYQELIHVPLLIRFPGQTAGRRVGIPVSTRRLFHTALDAAGARSHETVGERAVEIDSRSLAREANGDGVPEDIVISEAYAPAFALQVIEAHKPALIERLHCRATHWATYEGAYKLISIEDTDDRLFHLDTDPSEGRSVGADGGRLRRMAAHLRSFLRKASAREPGGQVQRATNLDDVIVRQRLRDLGYIE